MAAKLGFKEAGRAAKAVIMEPIMKLEVVTPKNIWVISLVTLTREEVLSVWTRETTLK
jgi:translation elongation factor EF-G